MFLSDFSIKRPIVTVVLIIGMMWMGLLALQKLRVNQYPDIQQPTLIVDIAYPGASPDSVDREVVNRIEKSLQGINGVTQLFSNSYEGTARFSIFFDFKKNMIEASDEVRNAIASVRYKLPNEMREPIISRFDPGDEPVMSLALSSKTLTHTEISRMAEIDLAPRLRAIEGVSLVDLSGELQRELSVLLRSEKLRAYNVSVTEVVAALRNQNTTAPVGKIGNQLEQQSIRLVGRIESPAEFEQIVVKRRGDEVVRLGQVASIADGFADERRFSSRNGLPNISLAVMRANNASAVKVGNQVREMVAAINENKILPKGTELVITQDGGKEAQNNLTNVVESLMIGALLTILVVYVFLNSWRSTLITALSLPTSAIASFIAVWLCGFTLNFMTLLGLSLAIGVLIDDAIVVRENIVRHMEAGLDRMTAARVGTAEIGMAVAATTFSIIAVFVPVAFMPGIGGEWFRPFALTVASSVLVSLFISFTLDPMLSAYWGDPASERARPRRGIGALLERFNRWFDHQAGRYGDGIAWALRHRWAMVIIAFACLGGACLLGKYYLGAEFLPAADQENIAIDVRTPPSSSLRYAQLKMEKAAEVARGIPEVRTTNATITPEGGRIYVEIGKRTERRRSAQELSADLRERLARLVGAEYTVQGDLNNNGSKPVQLQFSGPDPKQLTSLANAFMLELRKVKGAIDVGISENQPQNELRIELQRGLASSLGISAGDAAHSLRVAFAGIEVGDWIDPTGESRDVAVRLHPDDRVNLENIAHLPIAVGNSDRMIPLDQIATISMGKSPSSIEHIDGKRNITVGANAQGRTAGDITRDALELASRIEFPPGYGLNLGGSSRTQDELFTEMKVALIAGTGLMYLVLVMQFSSFSAPLAVMVSLPMSLIGVVVALLATKNTLNLMSMIGVIMLMGLVAKNAILLLDCARERESQGYEREDALRYAGKKRLRPILMTTFALIAGMLPVAIGHGEGAELYRPLAVAIIGGTLTSTVLTLLVVPSCYDVIEIISDRLFRRQSLTQQHQSINQPEPGSAPPLQAKVLPFK
ncbi:MAG: hypothetical protein RL748_4108 [Pseudomonadota bacterium]